VPLGDPRRQDARSQWQAALQRDGRSRRSQHGPARADRAKPLLPIPESRKKSSPTLVRLLAFGVLAWGLGVLLSVIDDAGHFARTSAIGFLLVLGFLACLVGLAIIVTRLRPRTKHVLIETEIRDTLTGLPNERYLLIRLDEEVTRALRYERPLALAVLDVNGLATVNEQYGRDCGDEVLRHVATVVQETKRASDILVRLDEDEFAIVLPECNDEGGQAFLHRLSERLAREPAIAVLNNRPSHIWVGVCAGLADVRSKDETPVSLLERARADLANARDERDRRRQRWRAA
jgi:diguanylate cyclase (GGDEF)-like protein